MLGAVADETHSPILLPITGIHHVHVQPSNACAQGVVRRVAAAALDLGAHTLPSLDIKHVSQRIHRLPQQKLTFLDQGPSKGSSRVKP